MRHAVIILIVLGLAVLIGCGGGSSSSSSTTSGSVSMSPATLSLNQTDVSSVTATVLDSAGAQAGNPKAVTFSSDNTAVATVNSSTGAVCAGVWDANFIVCAPGKVGTATITATSGAIKGTTTVYVHQKVDRVVISTPTSVCKSVGQTLQLAATAFSNGVDVTSTVGPFNWGSNNSQVATIDTNGLLTAQAPGTASVFAGVSNVSSVPATYTTCAVRSVHVHLPNATTSAFTLTTIAATQALNADVVDTAGNTITPALNWVTTNPNVATVSATGVVTSVGPGTASITAECAVTCNYSLPPVYGEAAVATVSGTSATTVYVTGTSTTSLLPIDTGTNTAGTAVTLPSQPNSMVFQPSAARAFLGSTGGVMILDTSNNSVTQNTTLPGKVLATSRDSNLVVIADTNSVYVQNFGSGAVTTLSISGATAASFTPDSTRLYIVSGSTMYFFTTNSTTPTVFNLSAPAADVAVVPSSAFVFLAGGAPGAISARATCDNSAVANYTASGTPTKLGVTPDASKVLATDSPNIDIVTRTSLAQPGCPPPLQAALTSVDLGQGSFTAQQMVVSPDGSKAYIISNLAKVIVFDVTAGTASAIPLANGATGLSESITLDGAKLYVGGSDNNVHLIDTATANDKQQISVTFTPNLVAVRPK